MLIFLKFIIGLLLLPLAAALVLVFVGQVQQDLASAPVDPNTWWFVGGFLVWLILFALFPKPVRTYVLAHELTHALWGLLMGAKVSRLRVGAHGGSVTLDKTNFLITLAPYFFPFYSVLALGLFLLLGIWFDPGPYLPFWYALFGLTWSFHLCFTLVTLGISQPDIQEHGRLFSYVLIFCVNLATAALLLNLFTGRPITNLRDSVWQETRRAYTTSAEALRTGSSHLVALARNKLQ